MILNILLVTFIISLFSFWSIFELFKMWEFFNKNASLEKTNEEIKLLEKEKQLKAKSKKFTDEEDKSSKKKPSFKDNKRVNTRKLTYIIDEDSDSDGFFHRKRRKHRDAQVSQVQKEYKKIE